jgi:hypothetical protein
MAATSRLDGPDLNRLKNPVEFEPLAVLRIDGTD